MSTRLQEKATKGMSSSQKIGKKDMKAGKNDDVITGSKQLTLAEATPLKFDSDASGDSVMLAELRKLRQENNDSFRDLKTSLQVESSMEELKQRTERLDRRLTDAEDRESAMEDSGVRWERGLGYLLQRG